MRLRTLSLALLLACGGFGVADAQEPLKIDRETQARLGLREAPLAAARHTGGGTGFARGIDLTPLATLESDLAVARAAAVASSAEAKRTTALARADATVSRKVAEAAAAQARGDLAKVALLRRRVGLEWGAAFAAMSDARRSALVAAAASGRTALVRIDLIGVGQQAGTTAELDLGPRGRLRATILGPARGGDPRATSPGLLALVNGPAAAWVGVGTPIPAAFTGTGASGVVIPREALLRTAGQTFAYVRRGPDQFERRPIVDGVSEATGLFAPRDFRPGEAVVVSGAAKLFAAEKTPAKEG